MKAFSWPSLLLIAVILTTVAVAFIALEPSLPGRWCKADEQWFICLREWQALIAGILALLGALLVLVAASWESNTAKNIAAEEQANRVRAARMRLGYQLELLATSYQDVLKEIANPGLPNAMPRMYLPQPAFDFGDLTTIPPEEGEALLNFAHVIAAANENLVRYQKTRPLVTSIARSRAAKTILTAIEWRDPYAPLIGWKPMRFTEKQRSRVQAIINAENEAAKDSSIWGSGDGEE